MLDDMIMQNDSRAFTQLQWVCVWLFGFDCLWLLVGNLCGEWNQCHPPWCQRNRFIARVNMCAHSERSIVNCSFELHDSDYFLFVLQ